MKHIQIRHGKEISRFAVFYISGSQKTVPEPAAAISPENFLEMKILRPRPIPTGSETLGWNLANCFNKSSRILLHNKV